MNSLLIIISVAIVVTLIWVLRLHRVLRLHSLNLNKQASLNKQRLEALIEKDWWYNALFYSAHEAILIMDENIILDCNKQASELLGTAKENICGKTPFDFSPEYQSVGESSAEKGNLYLMQALENKHTTFEWIHKRADGSLFNAEISLNVFSSNGKTYLTVAIRDITERKKIETELKSYQLNLEVLVSEKTEDFETINTKLVTINEELQNKNRQLQIAIEHLQEEIGQRKNIQEQLEQSEEKYRSFILQSGLGIVLFDANGCISEWNYKMTEYTGIEKEGAQKRKIWELDFLLTQKGSGGDRRYEKFKTIIDDYLQRLPDAPIVTLEAGYELNNRSVDLSLTLFPIQTSAGITIGQIVKDISESKIAETELQNYRTELENLVIKRTGEVMDFSQRYQEILRNTSEAIYIIDVRNRENYILVSVNNVMEELLGIKELDVLKIGSIGKVFEPDLAQKINYNITECLKQGSSIERIETLVISGAKKYFRTLFVPLKNDNGEIHRIAGFSHDVTAEQQIREEQEFNTILFNNVQSLILVLDREGRIVRFNNACEQLSGFNASKIMGSYYWEVLQPKEQWAEAQIIFNDILNKKIPIENQSPWNTFEFGIRQILWNYSWIHDNDGEVQFIVVSGTDITIRLEIETALRKSENKFRNIFNNSLDGIAITGKNRMFVEVNPMIIERTGYSRAELLSMRTFDIFPEKYHKILTSRLFEMIQGKELVFFESEVISKEKTLIPVELNGKLIEYEGEPAILTFIRDITERRQLESRLMEIVVETEEKERKAMAGDLHDELGPLLASLGMYTSTIARKLQNTDHNNVLEIIRRLIKEAVEKTRELSNNLSPHLLENFGLEAAIKTEIENTRLILPVKVISNLNEERFDGRIETVFYRTAKELMNNTRKYAKATEAIIKLSKTDNLLEMIYSDNGVGFSYEQYLKANQTGIGLLNIGNRARSIKGTYNIKTAPGRGFEFSLQCQVKNN